MTDLLEAVKFFIANSDVLITTIGDIFLVNKSGDKVKLIDTEKRKNLSPMLTFLTCSNKKIYYNLEGLGNAFVGADLEKNVIVELEKFYTGKNKELEEQKERIKLKLEEKAKQEQQAKKVENERMLQESLVKHKSLLIERGVEYKGFSEATYDRTTHCFSCLKTLNTEQNYVCNVCGYLICFCGKCFCSY
jgi:hypothetical protein